MALNNLFLIKAAKGSKVDTQKREILRTLVNADQLSITDISKQVNLSIPTITKFLGELTDLGYVTQVGYISLPQSARKAVLYGLKPSAGYYIGLDITRQDLKLSVMDFSGQMLCIEAEPFTIVSDEKSLENICQKIDAFIARQTFDRSDILAMGVSITGRVDSAIGKSYSYYNFNNGKSLSQIMKHRLGFDVYVENDSRAMLYGEYIRGRCNGDNVILVNLSWGFSIAIMIDGKIFYGKSGFAGEYGHTPLTNNEILCQCGKRGCLETAVSGMAAHRMIIERLKQGSVSSLSRSYQENGDLTMNEIIEAVLAEDMLAIEVIEQIGELLGRAVSGIINIFNPETIIFGGDFIRIKDYLTSPIRSGVNKYSLRIASRDTHIISSELGTSAAIIGASMLARSKNLCLLGGVLSTLLTKTLLEISGKVKITVSP